MHSTKFLSIVSEYLAQKTCSPSGHYKYTILDSVTTNQYVASLCNGVFTFHVVSKLLTVILPAFVIENAVEAQYWKHDFKRDRLRNFKDAAHERQHAMNVIQASVTSLIVVIRHTEHTEKPNQLLKWSFGDFQIATEHHS